MQVTRLKRCDLNLAPTITSSAKGRAYSSYSLLLARGKEQNDVGKKKDKCSPLIAEFIADEKVDSPDYISDLADAIQTLDSTLSTSILDKFAFSLFHPANYSRFSDEVITLSLKRQLIASVRSIAWSKSCTTYRENPLQEAVESQSESLKLLFRQTLGKTQSMKEKLDPWDCDFRFLGEWWISLRFPFSKLPRRQTAYPSVNQNPLVRTNDGVQNSELSHPSSLHSGSYESTIDYPHWSGDLDRSKVTENGCSSSLESPQESASSFRDVQSEGKFDNPSADIIPQVMYPPHLSSNELQDEEKINHYVARLAMRFRSGPLFRCGTVHFDHLDMTPERMHVMLFDGVVLRVQDEYRSRLRRNSVHPSLRNLDLSWISQKEHKFLCRSVALPFSLDDYIQTCSSLENEFHDELLNLGHSGLQSSTKVNPCCITTISFSICNIGNGTLMVLLSGLMALYSVPPAIENLDLSYNSITHTSLHLLAALLPHTRIKRLSLRGNNLFSQHHQSFRDFFGTGCYFVEELDLSYTNLSSAQLQELAELLPQLRLMQVLILNGVTLHERLFSGIQSRMPKDRNFTFFHDPWKNEKQEEEEIIASPPPSTPARGGSFFRCFYKTAEQHGWRQPDKSSLGYGYRPFRFNDPSLPDHLYPFPPHRKEA